MAKRIQAPFHTAREPKISKNSPRTLERQKIENVKNKVEEVA
jgi:hypothetical protein